MADKETNNTKDTAAPAERRFETGFESDISTTTDVAGKTAFTRNADALSYEFGGDGNDKEQVAEEVAGKVAGEEGAEAPAEGKVEAAAEVLEDLGEFNPDDPEVTAKYDARYFKDGKLNKDVLSKEFFANRSKDPNKAGLNEDTYKFLDATLGISKDVVKDIEAALVAQNQATAGAFYGKFGGQKRVEDALKWGKEGSYSEAQRKRFNEARDKGGAEYEEQLELLMARYNKARPWQERQEGRRGPPQRRSSPERSTTAGAGAGGASDAGKGFASLEDYQQTIQKLIGNQRNAKTREEKATAEKAIKDARIKAKKYRFGS